MTNDQPDSMTKGLLPCPFCGVGDPVVWLYRDKPNHIIEPKWNAHCKACNIVLSARGKKDAIAAWNRRPTPSSADNALREAAPLIEVIAEWERENGTLAAIMPSEYDGFMARLKRAAVRGSARAALTSSPAVEAEPVAYRYVYLDYAGRKISRYGTHAERVNGSDPVEVHPLYAAPQPTETQRIVAWQPIESAPKDQCILLASLAVENAGKGPEWSITAGYWDAEFEWDNDVYRGAWTDDSVASWAYEERVELSPTHWMPLPEGPTSKERQP